MKHIKYPLYALLAATALCACSEEEYVLDEYIPGLDFASISSYYNEDNIYFSADGGDALIEVWKSEGVDLTVEELPTWLTSLFEEPNLHITAAANRFTGRRSAIFDVLATGTGEWQLSRTFTANQEGSTAYVWAEIDGNAVSSYTYYLDSEGGEIEVDLDCNTASPDIYTTEPDILTEYVYTPETTKQKLKITVGPSTTVARQSHNVTMLAGYSTLSLTIYQEGATFEVNKTDLNFTHKGGEQRVRVNATLEWTASCPYASWLEAKRQGDEIIVQLSPNASSSARSATVYVDNAADGTTLHKISVKQTGRSISIIDLDDAGFDYSGGTKSARVVADFDWKVISAPAWVTVTPSEGKEGTTSITITAAANQAVNSRSGKLTVGAEGWSGNCSVSLTQGALDAAVSSQSVQLERSASSATVEITAPGEWTASTSASWLTLSPASGFGNGKLTISATENPGEEQRRSAVSINIGGKEKTIAVTQAGVYFTVNVKACRFGVFGATDEISVSSNVGTQWSLLPDEFSDCGTDWLSGSFTDGTLRLTAAYNNSTSPRGAYVEFKPQTDAYAGMAMRVPVTQAGRTLEVSALSCRIFGSGGITDAIAVTADGAAAIDWKDAAPDWATLNVTTIAEGSSTSCGSYTFTITCTENYSTASRRAVILVSLADLADGQNRVIEIPVTQYGQGGSILREEFGDDHDWNYGYNGTSLTITLSGWGDDRNWDDDPSVDGSGIGINTGWGEDKDWN